MINAWLSVQIAVSPSYASLFVSDAKHFNGVACGQDTVRIHFALREPSKL